MRPWRYLRAQHRPARRLVMAGLAVTLGVLLPALAGAVPGTTAVIARADDVTASQDALRTGWDPNETAMGPSAVPTFVQRFSTAVSGQVYAQPVVIGPTVIVATENDRVYGLDATTGAVKWKTPLGTPYNITKSSSSALRRCGDLVPNTGVTGTPVYDPGTGDVFLFAQVVINGKPKWDLFGIDPRTGAITLTKRVYGHPRNNSHITFNPEFQLQRPSALLLNGSVYAAFGSRCDKPPYTGYVAGVRLSTRALVLWTDESGITYNKAGIWQSGGGVMSDGPGRIFVTSGNGVSPAAGKGTSPPGQLAESVIRLGVSATGALSAKDFFSPANAPSLDAANIDFGGGAPVGLPFGTSTYPRVLAQGGKDGRIFLLNRTALGGRKQGPGSTDAGLFVTRAYGAMFGHQAVFGDTPTLTTANAGASPTDNDFLFSVGKSDVMRVFRLGDGSSDKPVLSNVANSSLTYGFTSGSPVVTSNGTDPTSAVVWEVYAGGSTGAGGELEAYSLGSLASTGGTPSSCTQAAQCTLPRIWHSGSLPQGTFTAAKFSIPATSNGWVYIGTRDQHVIGYSAPATAAPVQSATATFPHTGVSSATTKGVSITAKRTVTLTGVSASTGASNATARANQFTVGQVTETRRGSNTPIPVTFPVTLSRGDKLTGTVTFAPAAPGAADGTLSFTTSSATFPTVDVPLAGEGTQGGLYPQASALSFRLALDQGFFDVPVGIAVPQVVNITNFSTSTQTVTSVTPPTAPFSAAGLPHVGAKLKPGDTVSVQVTFAPTRAAPATGSFTIAGGSGTPATVTLSGTGAAPVSQISAAKPAVNFGTIPVGKRATTHIHVTNTGNQPSVVTATSSLPRPFAAPLKPAPGLPFSPDNDLAIPVTFTPTRKGTFSTHYRLSWTDPTGTHTLTVTLTGTAD
jgi:hypothetical protein